MYLNIFSKKNYLSVYLFNEKYKLYRFKLSLYFHSKPKNNECTIKKFLKKLALHFVKRYDITRNGKNKHFLHKKPLSK